MTGALVLDWGNLWVVALPFLTSACIAGIFTVLVSRVSRNITHHRLLCAQCVFEDELIANGKCEQNCAVNNIPSLPMLLFFFSTEFALLALFYPSIIQTYILPAVLSQNEMAFLGSLLLVSTTTAAVMLGVYLVQEKGKVRSLLLRVTILGTLGAILVASFEPSAAIYVPVGLFALVLILGVELRARYQLPLLGLRSVGAATLPLFVVTLIGIIHIYEILRMA